MQGCTGSVVLRQTAANLTPLVQPVADGNSIWRGRGETHQIDRQMKHRSWIAKLPIYKKPLCNDTLVRSEFEYHLITNCDKFVNVFYNSLLMFCERKISIQINNDAAM